MPAIDNRFPATPRLTTAVKRVTRALEPTPNVSGRYGASMGRADRAQDTGLRIHLQHVPLDSGGYDRGGAYWGHDLPLYAYDDGENDWSYTRARNRADAKRQILAKWPDAKFYR